MLPPPAPTFLTSTDERPGDVAGEDAVQPGLARELHLAVPRTTLTSKLVPPVSQTTMLSIGAATSLPATGAIAGPELTV